MFDLGFQELIVIFLVALLVFGPKKLPELSRNLGRWVGEIRRGIHHARMQMETEFDEIEKKTGSENNASPVQEEKPAADTSSPEKEKDQP